MKSYQYKKSDIALLAVIFLVLLAAFNNPFWHEPRRAREALENAGYTDIEILPYRYFARCGRIGPWRTPFTANRRQSRPVTGLVCRSPFGHPYIKIIRKKDSP